MRLFDQLIGCSLIDLNAPVKLADGSTMLRDAAYRRAHAIALQWMIDWPQKTGAWTACCEDVQVDTSLTNYNSVEPMCKCTDIMFARSPRRPRCCHCLPAILSRLPSSHSHLAWCLDALFYYVEHRVPGWEDMAEDLSLIHI